MSAMRQDEIKQIKDCVFSFHQLTGLGCLLCAADGSTLMATPQSVKQCALCQSLRAESGICAASYSHGWTEAERFGGKYIYNCPMGLTCIATPVQTDRDTVAFVTAGPFLIVEKEDFIQCELASITAPAELTSAGEALAEIPVVPLKLVEPIARQLFLAIGGVGKSFRIDALIERQNTSQLMGELNEFTGAAKRQTPCAAYPLNLEKEFLHALATSDRANMESLLNLLLGHIFFCSGGDFSEIRARICELLVLSTRAAIDGGADEGYIIALSQRYIEQMQEIYDVDKLCFWLTAVLKQLVSYLFHDDITVRRDIMPRALSYIRSRFGEHITLEDVAQSVHLSPSYFSRLFKDETGSSFSEYLLSLRIEQAKWYLLRKEDTMAEIAQKTGFFDQSHFIKSFKQATGGMTPGQYRRSRGYIKEGANPEHHAKENT